MRHGADRRPHAEAVEVGGHATAQGEEPTRPAQGEAAEEEVARLPLVRDRVVDEGQDCHAAPPESPGDDAPDRRQERHPVREDDHLGAVVGDPVRRPSPRPRVEGVESCGRAGHAGRDGAGLELRRAGEQPIRVQPPERDGADVVSARGEAPGEARVEMSDAAAVRPERAEEGDAGHVRKMPPRSPPRPCIRAEDPRPRFGRGGAASQPAPPGAGRSPRARRNGRPAPSRAARSSRPGAQPETTAPRAG